MNGAELISGLAVSAGASLGALTRYLTQQCWKGVLGVYAVFAINIIGCFIAGLIAAQLMGKEHIHLRAGLITGFCGALTTFSAFAQHSSELIQERNWLSLGIYFGGQPAACILSYLAGERIAEWIKSA